MQAIDREYFRYTGPLSGILLRNKSYLTEPYSAPGRRRLSRLPLPACRPSLWHTMPKGHQNRHVVRAHPVVNVPVDHGRLLLTEQLAGRGDLGLLLLLKP